MRADARTEEILKPFRVDLYEAYLNDELYAQICNPLPDDCLGDVMKKCHIADFITAKQNLAILIVAKQSE